MSDTGIYLLVHNLASDLTSEAKVRFSEKGHERVIDFDDHLSTNMDYLFAWLSSVYTAAGNRPNKDGRKTTHFVFVQALIPPCFS